MILSETTPSAGRWQRSGYEAISLVLARLQAQSATGTWSVLFEVRHDFPAQLRPLYGHTAKARSAIEPVLCRAPTGRYQGRASKALRSCSSVSGPSRSGVSTNDRRAGAKGLRQVFTIGAQRRHQKLAVAIAAIHFKALRMAAVGVTPTKPPTLARSAFGELLDGLRRPILGALQSGSVGADFGPSASGTEKAKAA